MTSTQQSLRVLLALLFSALLALAGAPAARAAQASDLKVSASLSAGVVKLGERASIVVVIEGSQAPALSGANPFGPLPEVDGLALGPPTGPNRTSFQEIVGRRVTTTVTERWLIPIRPERAGEFEIPPLTITAGGKRYTSAVLRLKVVEDMAGADLGFLEVTATPTEVIKGLPFTVEVRFGWDAGLTDVNFVDLSLPFFGGVPGALELDRGFAPGAQVIERGVTVNGDTEVQVEEIGSIDVRGRRFRQLRLTRAYVPTRPGRLEFGETFLNFGRLGEGGSFFQRRYEKVKSYFVKAPRLYVDVEPLPEEGQPYDFTGAVGTISASASVDARDVDVGESIKLTVEWTGTANFEFFDAPDPARMDAFQSFRVYGRTDEKSFDRRKAIYDLAPIDAGVDEIPPLPLRVFDPAAREYTTVETEPIPIRVHALEGAVELAAPGEEDEGPGRDLCDIDARPLAVAGNGGSLPAPPARAVIAILIGVPIAGLIVRALARRGGDPSAPAERRRRRARAKLSRALRQATTPEEELRALYAFLAERTREPVEAWVGRDPLEALAGRLTSASNGTDRRDDDLGALRELLERLEASVWAGRGERVDGARILDVADRLIGAGL